MLGLIYFVVHMLCRLCQCAWLPLLSGDVSRGNLGLGLSGKDLQGRHAVAGGPDMGQDVLLHIVHSPLEIFGKPKLELV